MKKTSMLMSALAALLTSGLHAEIFDPGEHAVAWRAGKVHLGVPLNPVGKNTAVDVAVEQSGKGWKVKAVIPAKGFDSGIGMRDRDVNGRLGDEKHPNILFESEEKSADWFRGLGEEPTELAGTITIQGEESPLAFQVREVPSEKGRFVAGEVETDMTRLGVEPPTMFLIRIVFKKVKLAFQFDIAKIQNAEKILK